MLSQASVAFSQKAFHPTKWQTGIFLPHEFSPNITPSIPKQSSSANTHHALPLHELLVPPVDILANIALATNLLGLLLGLVVNLHKPVVRHLALRVLALVAVLRLPVLRSVVVLELAVAALGLDALLVGELLPLGLLLLFGHGLLARQMCGRRRQVELQRLVVGGFCDGAQREQLVDQALGGVARDGAEGLFLVLGERGQRVGVIAEESAEVECEGLGFGLEVRHFEGLFGVLLGMRLESASCLSVQRC
jgi:hypothetical protein